MFLIMTRWLLTVICIPLFLLYIFVLLLLFPMNPKNGRNMGRPISKILWYIWGVKVEITDNVGIENFGPCIMAANHQSNFDILIPGLVCSPKTVGLGKKSLLYIPFFGIVFFLTGNILIDRGNRRKAFKSLKKALHAIKDKGLTVWIFAEGTRNQKGEETLLPFKKGLFHIAIDSQLPIIPVCVSRYKDKLNFKKLHAGTIKLELLAPVPTKDFTKKEMGPLLDTCRSEMEKRLVSWN